MESKANILFITPDDDEVRAFARTLADALPDYNIKISDAGFTTLLFEAKTYELIHFFTSTSGAKFGRKGSKAKIVQTLLNAPADPAGWKTMVFGDCAITFSEEDQQAIRKALPNVRTEVILPCGIQPDPTTLKGPADIRRRFDAGERMLVVALNDFSDHSHFQAFLYTAREYQRKGRIRFILPLYRQDKDSIRWRESLQKSVEQEKLTLTTFVEPPEDYHSLIDASDFCLYISKERTAAMEFPLNVAEALCAGKPVVCFNKPPVNEFVAAFKKEWIANTNEDFSRISADLVKHANQIEQLATELARYARTKLSVANVSSRYKEIYESLIQR